MSFGDFVLFLNVGTLIDVAIFFLLNIDLYKELVN